MEQVAESVVVVRVGDSTGWIRQRADAAVAIVNVVDVGVVALIVREVVAPLADLLQAIHVGVVQFVGRAQATAESFLYHLRVALRASLVQEVLVRFLLQVARASLNVVWPCRNFKP